MKNVLLSALCLLLMSYSAPQKEPMDPQGDQPYVRDYNAGVEAQNHEEYAKAVSLYQKALDKKPDFSDAWNNMGYCYRMIAKSYLAKSGSAYDKAVKYGPKNDRALEYQGEYYIMKGQLKKAFQNYQTLVNLKSDKAGELKDALNPVLQEAKNVLRSYSP